MNIKEHTGIIEITSVKNSNANNEGDVKWPELYSKDVRFVHYPDCQQLIIWLPQNGDNYSTLKVLNKTIKKIEEECPITKWRNGSIQLLRDTLHLSPGKYAIEINSSKGMEHEILFTKFDHTYVPQPTVIEIASIKSNTTDLPIIYKDGFGNSIQNNDLNIADSLKNKISETVFKRIEYEGNLRAGTITYVEKDLRIKFDHEMGGGNCIFFIFIPTEEDWEVVTKTHVKRRTEILNFVAETVKRDQASSSRVVIDYNQITFYTR